MTRKPDAHRRAVPGQHDERWLVGRNDLARILGVGPSNISTLVERGMPHVGHGRYSIPHCVQFYIDLWRGTKATARHNERLRGRLLLAQTRKYEIEHEVLLSHYIAAATMGRVVEALTAGLDAALDGLGERLAKAIAGETEPAAIITLLTAEARQVRERYATTLDGYAAACTGEDG